MIKDHRLSMRITTELRDALDKLAAADNRSLANYVESVLVGHVATETISTGERQRAATDIKRVIEHGFSARVVPSINDEEQSWATRPARPHPKPK